jgi:hypothetical protein
MKTLVLESVMAGRTKQLQYLLAQSRRIIFAGFDVPADLDVNLADRSGVTPLHTAVLKGSLPMVKLLLEAGADCSLMDSLGQSPLDLAESKCIWDIVQALHAHLSSHRAKSPRSRLSLPPGNTATHASAPKAEQSIDSSANTTIASSTVPNSRSGLCDYRSRQAGCRAPASAQLLSALSVSSVKKKSAITAVLEAAPRDSAGQQLSGDGLASMNAVVEVPRDAILDFKQWMRQKQDATAATTNLVPLSEVPETITEEDEEVCSVNRNLFRTACAKRAGTLQRPITPTIYGGARTASITPVASSNSLRHPASAASSAKVDWLLPPQQSSISNSATSAFLQQNKMSRVHAATRAKPTFVSLAKAVDELPRLPSSFLPRELDPSETARLQEQRQLAVQQQQMMAYEQETRSMTPAALNRLKRRVLGASACADDASSPLASVGDGADWDAEVTTPSSGFRLKRQAGLRLRRLAL